MTGKRRIAILTGGGDCPGINAVIRAAAKKAIYEHGYEVIGIEDGYDGLIHGRYRRLGSADVSGILPLGGTILGTSNTSDPYAYPKEVRGSVVRSDVSKKAIANVRALKVDALICVGGNPASAIPDQALNVRALEQLDLSRQALPTLDRGTYAPASGLARGAYVLADPPGGAAPAPHRPPRSLPASPKSRA